MSGARANAVIFERERSNGKEEEGRENAQMRQKEQRKVKARKTELEANWGDFFAVPSLVPCAPPPPKCRKVAFYARGFVLYCLPSIF